MNIAGLNSELLAFGLLLCGLTLAAIGFFWLLIAAVRGARAQGSLLLFLVAGLVFAFPSIVRLLNDQGMDLHRLLDVVDGRIALQLSAADGRVGPLVNVKSIAAVYMVGAAISALAFLWLLSGAFRQWSRVRVPVYLFIAAAFFLAAPFAINHIAERFIDLGPRERVVDGETHLTLTGWDQKDYSVLRARPKAALVQMANKDVTDDTLHNLESMDGLRELDLSDSQVTDAGLATLAKLPALETLRLARTSITDAGFKEHLASKESLKMLDLTGTTVTADTVSNWKKAKQGRRALR